MGRSTWYCIDIEASGPVPSLFDMISLGAVAVHEKDDGTLQLGDSFYVEIVPTAEGWEAAGRPALFVSGIPRPSRWPP